MLIMWIQLFRVLVVSDTLAFYLRLVGELVYEMLPFAMIFGISILMCTNLLFLSQSQMMWDECGLMSAEGKCEVDKMIPI